MNRPESKNQKVRVQKKYLQIKIQLFYAVLFLFALIGILIPLRPKTSEIEKRPLEKFPAFTISSFWDGTYFGQISTWYADTFPFRESLLTANSSFQELYGLQGEQIVGDITKTGDEIPQGEMVDETNPGTAIATGESTKETESETEPETEAETLPDGTIHTVPEPIGNVYITGNRGFGLYYFSTDGANAYIKMMNHAAEVFDGVATVYDILAPTSVGIGLDNEAQAGIGSSNQKDAFDYIYRSVSDKIKKVEVFDNIKAHNAEYIYFNTDHHWTALGAYYAYEEFAKAKGITPTPLSEFETREFTGFLGTFYSNSQSSALRDNPDTVIAYVPKGTNGLTYIDKNMTSIAWYVISDVTTWNAAAKYSCFAAGDEIYAVVNNPNITDGSSVAVVKDSYGNAFIPFLVDHYQTVHVVDYRYFKNYNSSLVNFVKENNIQDVVFINNADAVTNPDAVAMMENLLK